MDILSFGIELAKLIVMAIIYYYVCEFLPIPKSPKLIAQICVILIAIFAGWQLVLSYDSSTPHRAGGLGYLEQPSIMAPEKGVH